jgi:hypothetical protein
MRNRLPMIISITALLVAVLGVTPLGDAAYNTVVPRNSVGTLQLQRNAVKARQLAPNAVRSAHVLNGSLVAEDFKSGQLPQGPKGDKGAKGDKGDKGDPGPVGVSGYEIVLQNSASDSISPKVVSASCPNGKRVLGGGNSVTGGAVATAAADRPIGTNAWNVIAWEISPTSVSWVVQVYAICANVTS